jgi:hypothetical protein
LLGLLVEMGADLFFGRLVVVEGVGCFGYFACFQAN